MRTQIPNLISLARLLAVPVILWLILTNKQTAAFWLFLIAALSDAVDGYLAHRLGAETALGAYLDPIADKFMLVSVFIVFGVRGDLPVWLVILLVFRDFLIIGGALVGKILDPGFWIRPFWLSKVNTLVQMLLAASVLAGHGFALAAEGATTVLMWFAAVSTALSGALYTAMWVKRVSHLEQGGSGAGRAG